MQKRILIVDDDEPLLESLALALTKKGYEVGTASSVDSAIIKVEQTPYDIVLLDMKLGDRTGEEFLTTLDVFLLPSPKKIIVITGNAQKPEVTRVRDRVAAVLEKPFSLSELVEKIERHSSEG